MEVLIKGLQLVMSLSILIVLHEFGHYLAARAFGVRVEKFYLFFNPKFSLFKKKIGDTEWGIGWLPLGGYVKLSGMIDESMDTDQMKKDPQPWEFRSKPAWQRLIIMLGGIIVNIIVGYIFYVMVLATWGKEELRPEDMTRGFYPSQTAQVLGFKMGDVITEVDGKPCMDQQAVMKDILYGNIAQVTAKHEDGSTSNITIPDSIQSLKHKRFLVPVFSTVVAKVDPEVIQDSADYALRSGDSITGVDNYEVEALQGIAKLVSQHEIGDVVVVDFVRNGESYRDSITLGERESRPTIGVDWAGLGYNFTQVDYSLGESLASGFSDVGTMLVERVKDLKLAASKEGSEEVGSFLSIGNMFPAQWDWQIFWSMTALLSLLLAVMNLLPIPGLDGGHVMFLLYEMATGKEPSEKAMEWALRIGFLLLILLMLLALKNDVMKFIVN